MQWDVQYVMYKLHNNAIKVQAIYMYNGMFYAHIEESVWKNASQIKMELFNNKNEWFVL